MDACLAGADFDVATTAGWYSSIAGLLAGFAFIAVLLPLDHRSTADDDAQTGGAAGAAAVAFICAFFALLTLSAAYAVLAGRVDEGPAAALAVHEQVLYGASFGLATILLLFGLHAVLRDYGANRRVFGPADDVVLATSAVLGPAVLLALQFSNALDAERYRLAQRADPAAPCGSDGIPAGVWFNAVVVVVALAALLLLAANRRRLPHRPGAQALAAKGVLGLTVAAVAWSSAVAPLLPTSVLVGAAFEHASLVVTAGLTVALSATSWLSR